MFLLGWLQNCLVWLRGKENVSRNGGVPREAEVSWKVDLFSGRNLNSRNGLLGIWSSVSNSPLITKYRVQREL